MELGKPPLPHHLGDAKLQISLRFSVCLHCEIMQPIFFRSENNCSLIIFSGVDRVHGLSLRFCTVFSGSLPLDLFIKLTAPSLEGCGRTICM